MRLYISGPMTGVPDHNFPAFNAAAELLEECGYTVINPADTGIVEGWAWSQYLRYDLKLMLNCEGVALLPGWKHSKGARLEFNVASSVEMPVRMVDKWPALDWRQAS